MKMETPVANISTLVVLFVTLLFVILVICMKQGTTTKVMSTMAPVLGVIALALTTVASLQYTDEKLVIGWIEKSSLLIGTVLLFVSLAIAQGAQIPLNYTALALIIIALSMSITTLGLQRRDDDKKKVKEPVDDQWPIGMEIPNTDTQGDKLTFAYPRDTRREITHPDDQERSNLNIPGNDKLKFNYTGETFKGVEEHPDDVEKSKLSIPKSFDLTKRTQFWN
jgi:hypothetical protein